MTTASTYKKKLIEVAIPLEAINAASAYEKMPGIGPHPRGLHQYWARRPLVACRAVLFAQLVDDPSERIEELLSDPKLRATAETELPERIKAWENSKAAAHGVAANAPIPTLADVAVEIERKRLFEIIKELVKWENSTNEEVLERARAEIRKSCGGELPPVYDPFSGGGSIPLEAQRLGLPAFGSDLNPVAVIIGKAMIEIPSKFKGMPPIHPGPKERTHYRYAEGLGEDVRYYGEWIREKVFERIGHLYPKVDLPKEYGGGKATVVAWIWARTVPSPDPAFADVPVPIASSFLLSSKKGKEAWIEPIIDKAAKSISYRIRNGGTKDQIAKAKTGTKAGRGSNFQCVLSDTAITAEYIRDCSRKKLLSETLIAIVADGKSGRIYIQPSQAHQDIAFSMEPVWKPELTFDPNALGFRVGNYGMSSFSDMFTHRQLIALNEFKNMIGEVRRKIEKDTANSELSGEQTRLNDGGLGGTAYADAVSVFLAFAVDRCADFNNALTRWSSSNQKIMNLFGRQAIPMVWDFAEANIIEKVVGGFQPASSYISKCIERLHPAASGSVIQSAAQHLHYQKNAVISTDPPYYDNIGYADLSDFFYSWLRPALRDVYPDILGVLATPKSEELIASPNRHADSGKAEQFFIDGMTLAMKQMAGMASSFFPATIYYAFKQSEIEQEGLSSTGWATFLHAVFAAGYSVTGTWPLRTEQSSRMRGMGSNALANSVVLVCRKKEETAETITRAEFIRALKRELPPAIIELQAANIAPADMPQSAIGPGMGVFSRYAAVLESDDGPMSVKTALQLINAELDEYLGGIQGEFDADTRFAITWFEQYGMKAGEYGSADNLARARGISVESVKHAGIIESQAGKVRILKRDELLPVWNPMNDAHLTVWECLQYLVRQHEKDGLSYDTALLLKKIGDKAEAVKDLAYCLYDICANKRQDAKEATAYNALIADWSDLTREAAKIHDVRGDGQTKMNF